MTTVYNRTHLASCQRHYVQSYFAGLQTIGTLRDMANEVIPKEM